MVSRSGSRPAICVVELLHVARKNARARAWMGKRDVGGVGGGVDNVSWAISEVGVAGTVNMLEVDACRRGAEQRAGHR